MKEIKIQTTTKRDIMDITFKVSSAIEEEGKLCFLFTPHTTAALTINEFEPNIKKDLLNFYEKLAPPSNYLHNIIDNNAEAHLLSSIIKPFLLLPMKGREIALGRWQRILFIELDGPRERSVYCGVLK